MMRHLNREDQTEGSALLPAYGRRKLLGYADSFRDLARTYTYMESVNEKENADRQDCLLKRRLSENREILADHLNEVAKIITEVAQESYRLIPFRQREYKRIFKACRGNGILIRELFQMKGAGGELRLTANMKAEKKRAVTTEDVADFLSVLFDRRLIPEKGSVFFLSDEEYESIVFEQEAAYGVLTGAAKATRENEEVSGDTYSVTEQGNGNMVLALSDGMGSGGKAKRDSETVVDLLEKFLEAGFSKDMAIEMVNGTLIAGAEQENMSTLDLCDIDLYTGICELIKIGAANTYIKRGDRIEQITSDSLPLGIFHKLELEKRRYQLMDGDYIFMMSDGVVDGMGDEESLMELLERITMQNPQEMANYILQVVLHRTMGKVPDDMTVLVAGIWES